MIKILSKFNKIICTLITFVTMINHFLSPVKAMERDSTNKNKLIILYGEYHGSKKYFDEELELWKNCYKASMRDLFLELSYYTAELLNLYMKSTGDEILYSIYKDIENTPSHTKDFLEFYSNLKKCCPDTIFHGTDLGHQYWNSGPRYLAYLENIGKKNSYEYKRTLEVMNQGKKWYEELNCDNEYREKIMFDNFKIEYDKLKNKPIMGIYGKNHVNENNPSNMCKMLKDYYGNIISCKTKNSTCEIF